MTYSLIALRWVTRGAPAMNILQLPFSNKYVHLSVADIVGD